jgi:hypothetical protein
MVSLWPQQHSNPLLFFKAEKHFHKGFLRWDFIFARVGVCVVFFSLLITISFFAFLPFLNFNGPESQSLPRF